MNEWMLGHAFAKKTHNRYLDHIEWYAVFLQVYAFLYNQRHSRLE